MLGGSHVALGPDVAQACFIQCCDILKWFLFSVKWVKRDQDKVIPFKVGHQLSAGVDEGAKVKLR